MANADDGDTILIAKGRYQETVTTSKRVAFKGKKGAIWDGFFKGQNYSQLSVKASGVTVTGITFQHGLLPCRSTGMTRP